LHWRTYSEDCWQTTRESGKIGLNMNIDKTKLLTADPGDVHLEGQQIEKVNEYTYLGHTITLGKENQKSRNNKAYSTNMGCCRKIGNNIKKSNTSYQPKKKGFQHKCFASPDLWYGNNDTLAGPQHHG